jgi:hypothetical protein
VWVNSEIVAGNTNEPYLVLITLALLRSAVVSARFDLACNRPESSVRAVNNFLLALGVLLRFVPLSE